MSNPAPPLCVLTELTALLMRGCRQVSYAALARPTICQLLVLPNQFMGRNASDGAPIVSLLPSVGAVQARRPGF